MSILVYLFGIFIAILLFYSAKEQQYFRKNKPKLFFFGDLLKSKKLAVDLCYKAQLGYINFYNKNYNGKQNRVGQQI